MRINLVLILLLCYYLSNTNGDDDSNIDSIISTHRGKVPTSCLNDYLTLHCYELCKEDEEIAEFLATRKADEMSFEDDDTLYLRALKLERGTNHSGKPFDYAFTHPGRGFPCRNKCETNPEYWDCIEDCEEKDHTKLWSNCLTVSHGDPACKKAGDFYNLAQTSCINCLIETTKDRLTESCEFAHSPNSLTDDAQLCHVLDNCENGPDYGDIDSVVRDCANSQEGDIEKTKMCVNDHIMISQRKCCYAMRDNPYCGEDHYNCDKVCSKILTPRLCREQCKMKRDPMILNCTKNCQIFHPTSQEICDHCMNGTTKANEFNTSKDCVTACKKLECVQECFQTDSFVWMHVCLNSDLIRGLAKFAQEKLPELKDFKPLRTNWLKKRFTPLECESSSNDTQWAECKNFVSEERTFEEIEEKCNENPFRNIDMLACALELKLPDLSIDGIMEAAKAKPCKNEALQLNLYKLYFEYEEKELCKRFCDNDTFEGHPNHVAEMRCKIDECQAPGNSSHCKPLESDAIFQLIEFPVCRWKLDFSKAETPYFLWANYFNELAPKEIKHKLEHPYTLDILQRATYNQKLGYYTFPYFIVIRGVCEDNYYADGAYRFFMAGGAPIIEQKYKAPTARHQPSAHVMGLFYSSLIALSKVKNDTFVPDNPRSINGSEQLGCHARICHPGFAVPLMFLQIPIFEVVVNAHEAYGELIQTVHVAAFHSRSMDGKGQIQISADDDPPHAGKLFLKDRATFSEDQELNYYLHCFSTEDTHIGDDSADEKPKARNCPELYHILDDNDNPYDTNHFAPLDTEDILRSQFIQGTSPTQAFAGFYDPRFLIIGDADFNSFEVVNWGRLLKKLEGKPNFHSCTQTFKNRGFNKPIYSQLDNSDSVYPIKYYRHRYIAKPYHTKLEDSVDSDESNYADTAIFEAIGLEDRLLLVTTKGLVSFYGHTNATVVFDKAWTYKETEILNRCFKIVRVLPKAQPYSDSIVGVTYNYKTKNYTEDGDEMGEVEISQEIWMGKFLHPGHEITWMQLKSDTTNYESSGSDDDEAPRPSKNNAKSEVEAICIKAFQNEFEKATTDAHLPDPNDKNSTGWCEAIDATPVQMKEATVQLLVRMKIVFMKGRSQSEFVYFYILATSIINHITNDVVWRIDNIIPRIPCVYNHHEAVINVLPFDQTYFKKAKYGVQKDVYGCHNIETGSYKHHVFLHGMTYTRTLSNDLFLYGSRLLQSSNSGENFIYLQSFPYHLQDLESNSDNKENLRQVHRIVKMAFDDGGHYAFLTNKLELWLGSTGTLTQIRLRPSPIWRMVQIGVSKVKNVNDGVPFSVNYDSSNRLYEMVAIVGKDGFVSRIMKRPVQESKLLRFKALSENLKEKSKNMATTRKMKAKLEPELQKPFSYDVAQWSTPCAYVSPNLTQNFSKANTRTQGMQFPHPEQHILMGVPHLEGSLLTFQAATFNLVWRAFFSPQSRFYAGVNTDPFREWVRRKKSDAILSNLRFTQGNPTTENAILVEPRKYKRLLLETRYNNLLKHYFLDYQITAELRLEFSIRNDLQIADTEFMRDQIKQVQLNVENANGSIIQINTDKEVNARSAAVVFIIRMSVKRKSGLRQYPPGINLLPIPVTYHLIGAFGQCLQSRAQGNIGDRIETVAMVGCPTNRDFVFDWNNTLASITFRGDRSHRPVSHGKRDQCYKGEFICFFTRNPLVFFFKIFDSSKQQFVPYEGRYSLRILAGGRNRDEMRVYTEDEIQAYNIPGVSDVSLIWNKWDPIEHQVAKTKEEPLYDDQGREIKRDNREVILDSGVSSIFWVCHTLSPCARIAPTSTLEVAFWFRILISNRDVEQNTLCVYEKEFDILLYGFPPSPETQLFITLGFSFVMLGILYLLYVCCRKRRRVWVQTKGTAKNWFFIVKDAIPKKLRFYEPPLAEENLAKGHKKDRERGSRDLGHVDSNVSLGLDSLEGSGSPKRAASSSSTLESASTSTAASSQLLPGGNAPYFVPSSTKEAVYDQILAKRLNTIVEKNRTMRTNLLKKASIHINQDDVETEEHFEEQFGRTVSQESVFTPPMPKAKKRGFEIFY